MTTARDLIKSALRKIHVLGRGQSLNNEEAQDALSTLNDLLDSWSVEGGLVFTETIETFNLTGAGSYTIGSGGDFNTTRPVEIVTAYTTSGDTDYALEPYDQTQYALITDKTFTGIPDIYYYDNNFPLGTLRLYPVPSGVSTITIHSFKPLSSFATLDATVTLPQGYERALIYNLATEIAPDYEKEASPSVQRIASESKSTVFTTNTRNEQNIMAVDSALLRTDNYNVYRGY